MHLKYDFHTMALMGKVIAVPVGDGTESMKIILRLNRTMMLMEILPGVDFCMKKILLRERMDTPKFDGIIMDFIRLSGKRSMALMGSG